MESNSEASCISDPNFAVICAFLERFASTCGIRYPPFVDLQEMLENSEEVPQELVELHIILLRKARRSVFREKWEKALVKFCHTYSTQDGWEIERFGYKNSRMEVKLRVLKSLLEGQFDYNCKFKSSINTLESADLRSKPLGKDKLGRIYWLQFDPTSNVRVYREDLDEESWTLVAKDRSSLVQLLQELSADVESLDVNLINEDSSVSAEIEKPVLDTGQENNVSESGDIITNGETLTQETDPLEIKDSDDVLSEVCNREIANDGAENDMQVTNEKRMNFNSDDDEREVKKPKLDNEEKEMVVGEIMNSTEENESLKEEEVQKPEQRAVSVKEGSNRAKVTVKKEEPVNDKSEGELVKVETGRIIEVPEEVKQVKADNSEEDKIEVGDAIEDPVLHVFGEGNGAECNAGNPDKEEGKNDEGNTANTTEQTESVNPDVKKVDVEIRPQPKLWSIDTICGTGSVNHSGESSKSVKSNQKNFSSFSIESVLEKKTDVLSQLSSPVDDAPVISVNTSSVNNIELKNVNDIDDETVGNASADDVESLQCNAGEEKSVSHEGQNSYENTDLPNEVVPISEGDKIDGDSTATRARNTTQSLGESIDSSVQTVQVSSESHKPYDDAVDDNPAMEIDTELKGEEGPPETGISQTTSPKTVREVSETNVYKESLLSETMANESEPPSIKESSGILSENREINENPIFLEDDKAVDETELHSETREHEENFEDHTKGSEQVVDMISEDRTDRYSEEGVKLDGNPLVEKLENTAVDESNENQIPERSIHEEEPPTNGIETEDKLKSDPFGREKTEDQETSITEKPDEIGSVAVKEELTECEPVPTEKTEPTMDTSTEEKDHPDSLQEERISEVKSDDAFCTHPNEKMVDSSVEMTLEKEAENEVSDSVAKLAESSVEDDRDPSEESVVTNEVQDIQKNETISQFELVNSEGPTVNKIEEESAEPIRQESEQEMEEKSEDPSKVENEMAVTQAEDMKPPVEIKGAEEDTPANEDISAGEVKEETLNKADETPKDSNEKPHRGRKRKADIQPEIQRTTRARKQSLDEVESLQLPTRTRTRKKSLEGDGNSSKKALKREVKRKSQEDSSETTEITVPEAADAPDNPAEEKVPEEQDNTAVNSISNENSTVPHEENAEPAIKRGRRRKRRGKRRLFTRVRKNIEQKRNETGNSSDEGKKAGKAEDGEVNGEEKKEESKAKTKESGAKTRRLIPDREIKHLGISNMEELPTVRQSRRIALLKLKEEAERSKLKQLEAAKEEEDRKKKKRKKKSKTGSKKRKDDESYEEEEDNDDEEVKKQEKEKKRKKKKDKLVFNELNPWISSSGSSSAEEEEDDIEDEAHEEEELLFKSDHEFSPESDVEDPDYKPIKRARTAKVDSKDEAGTETKYDDTACEKCGKKDHPEWILLCDKCDKGWHASCVRPALMVVPEGDWFCPPCEHASLVQKLRESLVEYDRCQKQRENEELRRKRLAFVGISLDNVLPSKKDKKRKPSEDNEGESEETGSDNSEGGSSSGSGSGSGSDSSQSDSSSSDESSEPVYQLRERRSNITSYRYNEYDELIKSALQEEMEAVKGVGLGKGKDITNQADEYVGEEEEEEEEGGGGEGREEEEEEGEAEPNHEGYPAEEVQMDGTNSNQVEQMVINPQIPRDIMQAKPKIRPKKENEDLDYVAESDDEEEYRAEEEEEENENEDEEEEELADEVPPVVPRYDKKKRKSRSLNVKSLDFTSDEEEEDNSDSDFKGGSSEEESDYSLPSESESSDGGVRKKKNFDGPLRRSTRARTARYDKEFINDESEDDAPRRKKSRNVWVDSESSDSDRSWGRRKKRGNRSSRSNVPKKKSKPKPKKKKNKKKAGDSDEDVPAPKKPRNRKIKFGGLDDQEEEEPVQPRRTRGKKINYREMNASDSEDEVTKRRPRVIGDSDEEFVAKEKSDDSDDEGLSHRGGKMISKVSIMRIIKKKRKLIPETEDLGLERSEELKEIAVELEDLDEEEEEILDKLLKDGEVPFNHLKETLKNLKERRSERISKPYPPIPDHLENPGSGPRFPKIGKMKITPNRPEMAPHLGIQPDAVGMRTNPQLLVQGKEGGLNNIPESIPNEQQGNMLFLTEQKKEGLMSLQPPPYPYPPDAAVGVAPPTPLMNFPLNNRPPAPFNSFQGMIPPHRLPPDYQSIPTTVLGIDKSKRKEGSLSDEEVGEDNPADPDSPSKRRARARGKKQLMEAQAKQELGISTVQAPIQFPPQGIPEGGSVITRMLNAPQPFPEFQIPGRGRPPFRSPFPNALRPPLNPPSPRLRSPAPGFIHASHPVDPASPAVIASGKTMPPGFPARPPAMPRYAADPNLRPQFPSQSPPPRSETFPYPNFYGPYPMPNNEEAPFHAFPNHPFDEHVSQIEGGTSSGSGGKLTYEEEAGGEFGGLASYFASQREDDLDT